MVKIVATNFAKSGLALLITGSANQPQFCAIGTGSGAVAVTNGSLVTEALTTPRTIWTSRDISVAKQVDIVFDFSSVTMSGIILKEFGVGAGSVIGVQNLWNREGFSSVTFDGSNELQIEVQFNIF